MAQLRPLSANEIVARLTENNDRRMQKLGSYSSVRLYHLQYTRFGSRREAELSVRCDYQKPRRKQFTVLSQSGSPWLIDKVLRRLLESENEAAEAENQKRTALSADNYDFELVGREAIEDRPNYVLRVSPKTNSKYLYRGKVWVDGADFAVTRIEAEPAKRPSFWIGQTNVQHVYMKLGEFWLPCENNSHSEVRLGGTAILTIRYRDYVLGSAVSPAEEAQRSAAIPSRESAPSPEM